ncbi:INO80 complex subunit D [Amyelois transitella]|uniref:INO80 complex subunit D n=1 Tax=Amyelois transitella TaxID=680683 RepID=UPI00298FB5F8|nr:INO80 complex subunit D [Amyelois transitella]
MSYLSTPENVGFSGISQNISDASCATQYKMAVESVPSNCTSEVNMFVHDSSGDDQTYITHLNDNYFHTKFKIDPNELYTFHDSDVIASEITVSHTEDAFIFPDNVDVKSKLLESPDKELDLIGPLTNGEIKTEIKQELISNGHYTSVPQMHMSQTYRDTKNTNTKAPKSKTQSVIEVAEPQIKVTEVRRPSAHSPKSHFIPPSPPSLKNSINSVSNIKTAPVPKQSGQETFLDVFKREHGLSREKVENNKVVVKTEPTEPVIKVPAEPSMKVPAPVKKTPTAGKSTPSKPRKGRGPAVHEALQRILAQARAVPVPNRGWHAPGEEMFQCGPLDGQKSSFTLPLENSSSDEDYMPDFESGTGPVCIEETAAESRGARLALRRSALRRQVARAHSTLRLVGDHKKDLALTSLIKKQVSKQGPCSRLPPQTVNYLLTTRGMTSLLSSQERRQLRETGWSGGESGVLEHITGITCAEERCTESPVPCGRYCLKHVTLATEQRLYASCAAVFAGGSRCKQPLLPLQDQTPLCAEHAWKRDNYDKLIRECRPKKAVPRGRAWAPPRPKRAKRRRRAPPRPAAQPAPAPPPPAADHKLSEINVCSNSSAYDSSDETALGALSENEYIIVPSQELEVEVEQVPHDDILDPAVLSQIPDEAFTEFFNQAEGGAPFAESSELAAALEAVLDERALDERVLDERALDTIADCVFSDHIANNKMQVPSSVPMEMSTSAPS